MSSLVTDMDSLLPHRPPFLFVDEVASADECGSVSFRTFRPEEFFFTGHFPNNPIVPGVIVAEGLGQSCVAGMAARGIFAAGTEFFLLEMDKTKFLNPVRPGDTCRFEAKIAEMTHKIVKFSGKAFVGDTQVCESEYVVYYRQPKPEA